ncbi:MAG: SDR family oxidoreductase [Caldilineaceae bacterium]
MLLQDKVVLITGSTTGIGESSVRRAVAEGAKVMVHGRRAEAAQALCAELGENTHYVIGDLGDPAVCAEVVQATVTHFGALHCVVNNAALTTRSNLAASDVAMFERIMSVNLRAPMLIIREAVPHFRRQGGGTILNIGSINALSGEPNLLVYSMSKGGMQTMTRNLANALAGEKIRVNQLNVGWTTTPNEIALKEREGLPHGWQDSVPKVYAPFGKLFTPEQVASHVVFWISDESYPTNGAVYELDQTSPYGRNPTKEF